MTKNTKAIIWATVAGVMFIIGIATFVKQKFHQPVAQSASLTQTVTSETQVVTPADVATSTPETVTTSTPATIRKRKPAPRLSYGDAVVKYENFRIQFAPGCLWAVPSQMVAKNPVTLMLDNRSDSGQKITLVKTTYTIKPYDYAIVTLNEKTLPQTVGIACNGQYNVAQILLQK